MHTVEVTYMLLSWEVDLVDGAIYDARCTGYAGSDDLRRCIADEIHEYGHPEEWDYDGMPVKAMLGLYHADMFDQRPAKADLNAINDWVMRCEGTREILEERAHDEDQRIEDYVRDEYADWQMEEARRGR